MIYKLDNGGTIKLQPGSIIPEDEKFDSIRPAHKIDLSKARRKEIRNFARNLAGMDNPEYGATAKDYQEGFVNLGLNKRKSKFFDRIFRDQLAKNLEHTDRVNRDQQVIQAAKEGNFDPEQFGEWITLKRDESPVTQKFVMPLVTGSAFGPAMAVASLVGEATNLGTNAITGWDTWGKALASGRKGWSEAAELTNPGYIVTGPLANGGQRLTQGWKTVANSTKDLQNQAVTKIAKELNKSVKNSSIKHIPIYHGTNYLGDDFRWFSGGDAGLHVGTSPSPALHFAKDPGYVVREGFVEVGPEEFVKIKKDIGRWTRTYITPEYNRTLFPKKTNAAIKNISGTYDYIADTNEELKHFGDVFGIKPIPTEYDPKGLWVISNFKNNYTFANELSNKGIKAIAYPNEFEGVSGNTSLMLTDPKTYVFAKHRLYEPKAISPQEVATTVHFDSRVKPLSKPINEAERLGIPKSMRSNPKALEDPQYWGYQQWNSRYNAAVNSGNIKEAQRVRDLHFKVKAPNAPQYNFYHGTFNKDKPFYVFEPQTSKELFFHFSPYKDTAEKFMGIAKTRNENGRLITAKLNIQRPTMVTDSGWWNWYRIPEANPRISKTLGMDGPTAVQYYNDLLLKEPSVSEANGKIMDMLGNDALMYKNYTEDVGRISVAIPRPSQIKLADPITRTNTGEVIPIVKRDNFHNLDIRYKQGGILKSKHKTFENL